MLLNKILFHFNKTYDIILRKRIKVKENINQYAEIYFTRNESR